MLFLIKYYYNDQIKEDEMDRVSQGMENEKFGKH
jgi:hypothetical protein